MGYTLPRFRPADRTETPPESRIVNSSLKRISPSDFFATLHFAINAENSWRAVVAATDTRVQQLARVLRARDERETKRPPHEISSASMQKARAAPNRARPGLIEIATCANEIVGKSNIFR
jgi:hypothetical protein